MQSVTADTARKAASEKALQRARKRALRKAPRAIKRAEKNYRQGKLYITPVFHVWANLNKVSGDMFSAVTAELNELYPQWKFTAKIPYAGTLDDPYGFEVKLKQRKLKPRTTSK